MRGGGGANGKSLWRSVGCSSKARAPPTSPPFGYESTTSTHEQALHAGTDAAEVRKVVWR